MDRITVEWRQFEHLSVAELYELLRFRQSIFVVEQGSPYEDLDGLDPRAAHLALRQAGELIGYLRIVQIGDEVRIGRVSISPRWRRLGHARRLMVAALAFCRERTPTLAIALAAQLPLVPFYQSLGFRVISEPYDDAGVAHVTMAMRP